MTEIDKKNKNGKLLIDRFKSYFKLYEILIIVGLVLVDQIIKLSVDKYVLTGNIIYTNFLFSITKLYNEGVSFSILANKTIFILLITIIALVFLIKLKSIYVQTIPSFGITLILAGAIGNLIDRIIYGHVIDYIKLNLFKFPIFNFADMLITLGFIIIILNEIYMSFKNRKVKNGK